MKTLRTASMFHANHVSDYYLTLARTARLIGDLEGAAHYWALADCAYFGSVTSQGHLTFEETYREYYEMNLKSLKKGMEIF